MTLRTLISNAKNLGKAYRKMDGYYHEFALKQLEGWCVDAENMVIEREKRKAAVDNRKLRQSTLDNVARKAREKVMMAFRSIKS